METVKPTEEEDAAKRAEMISKMTEALPGLRIQAEYEDLKAQAAEGRSRALKANLEVYTFNMKMEQFKAQQEKEGGDGGDKK